MEAVLHALVYRLQMVFNCRKCMRGWVIYNHISPPALHSCAVSLKDCPGMGLGLSAVKKLCLKELRRIIEIQKPNWICHFFFFSFKQFYCHSHIQCLRKGFFSQRPWQREVHYLEMHTWKCTLSIHDRQGPSVSLCHQKDTAVRMLPSCHALCFSSWRTPGSAKFPLHRWHS